MTDILYLKKIGLNQFEPSDQNEYDSIICGDPFKFEYDITRYDNFHMKKPHSWRFPGGLTTMIYYLKVLNFEKFIESDVTSNQNQLRSLIKKHFREKNIDTILNE